MKNIKLSVNMEKWRNDRIYSKEITAEQFAKVSEQGIGKEEKMEIFDASVIWGYGLLGYEFFEEGGKYYVAWRQGDTCD